MRNYDIFIDTLLLSGVKYFYGMPADSINSIYEGIRKRREELRLVNVRNERIAAAAAIATTLISSAKAACMGTTGPGVGHLIDGLYCAKRLSIPIVGILGVQDELSTNTGAFQDLNAQSLMSAIGVDFYRLNHSQIRRQTMAYTLHAKQCQTPVTFGVSTKTMTKTGSESDLGTIIDWVGTDKPTVSESSEKFNASGVDKEECFNSSIFESFYKYLQSDAICIVGYDVSYQHIFNGVTEYFDSVLCLKKHTPPGFGIAGLLSASVVSPERIVLAIFGITDLLEGLSDLQTLVEAANQARIALLCRDEQELSYAKSLLSVYQSIHITEYQEGMPPAFYNNQKFNVSVCLIKQPELLKFAKLPERIVYIDNTNKTENSFNSKLTFSTTEGAALAASSLSKLGASVTLEIDSTTELLASLDGIYDCLFDGGILSVRVKELSKEVSLERLFHGFSFLYISDKSRFSDVNFSVGKASIGRVKNNSEPSVKDLHSIANIILSAKRPLIIAGGGTLPSPHLVTKLADILQAGIVSTMQTYKVFADHPLYVGNVGSSGNHIAEKIRSQSDLFIYLGVSNRGVVYQVYKPGIQSIDVNKDSSVLFRNSRNVTTLLSSVEDFICKIIPFVTSTHAKKDIETDCWVHKLKIAHFYLKTTQTLSPNDGEFFIDGKLRPTTVIKCCNEYLDSKDSVLWADVGINTLYSFRYIYNDFKVIWTKAFACMGVGVAGALACLQLEHPGAYAIVGDGGFSILLGEICAQGLRATKENFTTIIVMNNSGVRAIRYEQELYGWPEFSSYYDSSYIDSLSNISGIEVFSVKETKEFTRALTLPRTDDIALRIINVIVSENEPPMPASPINIKQSIKFLKAWAEEGTKGIYSAIYTLSGVKSYLPNFLNCLCLYK